MTRSLHHPAVRALFLAVFPALAGQSIAAPVINEIMFHPLDASGRETPGTEYVELYNPDAEAVELGGWAFTGGVKFTFPIDLTLAPGAYLVVCGNTAAFTAAHPGVTPVVGNWTGQLSDSQETLELTDTEGGIADQVTYATEGDWAIRRRPTPAETDPPNGDSFAETHGWIWKAKADGAGKSLELRQPLLPNDAGQNWLPSLAAGGTPGAANSVKTDNLPPMITNVRQSPALALPDAPVIIRADLVNETPATATLHWRKAGDPAFTTVAMRDDGQEADERPGDGTFAARVPALPEGTIVEFYVSAGDGALSRTWPAPTDDAGTQGANALYQVESAPAPNHLPLYRVVMTPADRADFDGISNTDTNATFNATFLYQHGTEADTRYAAGLRLRGAGSRDRLPRTVRVDLANDLPWKGWSALNLNSQFPWLQVLGSHFAKTAGLRAASARLINLRLNGGLMAGTNADFTHHYNLYAHVEPLGKYSLDATVPDDSSGDVYSKRGDKRVDWNYRNGDVAAYLDDGWQKETNRGVDDWTTLDHFLGVINNTGGDGDLSAADLAQWNGVADLAQWRLYFGMNAFLTNGENSLTTGSDDDYSVYFNAAGKLQILPHDFDTILGGGDDSRITTANLPYTILDVVEPGKAGQILQPLVPYFARQDVTAEYYTALLSLLEGPFRQDLVNAEVDAVLDGTPVQDKAEEIKAFTAARRADILSQIDKALTVTSSAPVQSGFPRSVENSVELSGTFSGARGRGVTVNGTAATLDARNGTWTLANGLVTLTPGVNRMLVEETDKDGAPLRRAVLEVWYDDQSQTTVSGNVAANTTWTAAAGPYLVSANLTVANGATLTVEPGTNVYLASGVNFTVAGGGRLLAEGTAARPIRFTSAPGAAGQWGGMVIIGTTGATPETRITHAHFAGNSATALHTQSGAVVFLSHLTFGNLARQYLSLDGSSFEVSDCVFPTPTGSFEPVHGTQGIKAGGRGIMRRNLHGAPNGYNDTVDFTGGNRPGPILQVYDSIFFGSGDDELDLDSTDTWVEGNVFLHTHKNGSPDSSSAISGGADNADRSEITVVRNVFYDCDQAATAKQGNFYTFLNNTIVRNTKSGGLDTAAGVVNLADEGTAAGVGFFLENNIITEAESLARNYNPALSTVTYSNNILPFGWNGPGTGNRVIPRPGLDDAALAKLATATVEGELADQPWWDLLFPRYRAAFTLGDGSPAKGAGYGGADQGGLAAEGVQVTGAPAAVTAADSAELRVVPAGTTPYAWGYPSYRWRLDGGAWSALTGQAVPISLSGLTAGAHTLEVEGVNDAGAAQTAPTVITWTVDPGYVPPVILNEVLARNVESTALGAEHAGYVELKNPGAAGADVSGWTVSDDPAEPAKYEIAQGTVIPAGGTLVLLAGVEGAGPAQRLGFELSGAGGTLLLSKPAAAGGGVSDSLSYGAQLPDLSIGRGPGGVWTLNQPTPDAPNITLPWEGPQNTRINEWAVSGANIFRDDYVELYNAGALPAMLGGSGISDNPFIPGKQILRPLTFVAPGGFLLLTNSSLPPPNAVGLTFGFDAVTEWIVFSAPDGAPVDRVELRNTFADASTGREPDGAPFIASFPLSTFGFSNGGAPVTTVTSTNLIPARATGWQYDRTSEDTPANWQTTGGGNWQSGAAPLGRDSEVTQADPAFFGTEFGNFSSSRKTYFFRKTFPFSGDPADAKLRFTYYIDDGAVFYVNGQEAHGPTFPRVNLGGTPGTPVDFSADALSTAELGISAGVIDPPVVSGLVDASELLTAGNNVIAAEVHQRGNSSSDIVFDLKLDAVTTTVSTPEEPALYRRMRLLMENLRITEVMYAPLGGSENEWVELRNISATETLDLTGVRFTAGIDFTFPAMTLAPNAVICVVKDLTLFRGAYGNGPAVAGVFGKKLSNGGDRIVLQLPDPWIAAIQIFRYDGWWYPAADGPGRSLEIVDPRAPLAAWDDRAGWRASAAVGGSPGDSIPLSGFAAWAAFYGVSGATADADLDGLDNLTEYALGLSPVQANGGVRVAVGDVNAAGDMVLTFDLHLPAPADVTYFIDTAESLTEPVWTEVARRASGPWSGTATVEETPGGEVRAVIPVPAGAVRRFARLRFVIP